MKLSLYRDSVYTALLGSYKLKTCGVIMAKK